MAGKSWIKIVGPFLVLTFIYFIVGFLTTVNGQLQGPLKVAFLQDAGTWKNLLTTLISFFFFLGYLLNSSLASRWIDKKGYKVTLIRSLGVMVLGLMLYFLSSWTAQVLGSEGIRMGQVLLPWGYVIFLLGSFVMGSSAAMIQVVVNPYVSAYDLPGTRPVQRMNITTAVNSVGTTVAPFFVTGLMFAGTSLDEVSAPQLIVPFLLLALAVALVSVVCMRLDLPDLSQTRTSGRLPRSVWSFRHLALGVTAIFFYVGTEVSIGSNLNLHAMETGANGALLSTLYWGGFLVGRTLMSFFPNLSPRGVLSVTCLLAMGLIVLAMPTENLWLLSAVGLVHSVMWSCIFVLAVKDLGRYTSRASGVFMMGVFGGAVFPVLQGFLADALGSWQWTWMVALVCEAVMLSYAIWGCRVRKGDTDVAIEA